MDLSDRAPPQLTHPPWLPVTLNTEPALLRPALVGSQHPKFWLAHPMSLLPSPSAPNTMFLLFTYFYFVGQPGIALAELGPAQKEAPRWGLPASIPEQIKDHGAHLRKGWSLLPCRTPDSRYFCIKSTDHRLGCLLWAGHAHPIVQPRKISAYHSYMSHPQAAVGEGAGRGGCSEEAAQGMCKSFPGRIKS